jgi:hypothetical protein
MYIFDLQTFIWTKVEPKPDDPVPGPRYFHSADACEYSPRSLSQHCPHTLSLHLGIPPVIVLDPPPGIVSLPTDLYRLGDDHLVIFGGMGYADPTSEELCVLSDVRLFSLSTLSWLPVAPVQTASDDPANPVPAPEPAMPTCHPSPPRSSSSSEDRTSPMSGSTIYTSTTSRVQPGSCGGRIPDIVARTEALPSVQPAASVHLWTNSRPATGWQPSTTRLSIPRPSRRALRARATLRLKRVTFWKYCRY